MQIKMKQPIAKKTSFKSNIHNIKRIDNFIDKVLDSYMENLSTIKDIELYKMLLSFENIANIHYHIIPQRYKTILNEIKSNSSSKIKFKIMDILGE